MTALLLSSCNSLNRTGSTTAPTASATGSTASTTASSAPPPAVTKASLPKGDKRLGPGTVYSGCEDNVYGPSYQNSGRRLDAFRDGEVFNPKTGMNVPLPKPVPPPGTDLVTGGCTVGGDENNIKVFYVYSVSTPSSGLTPEHTDTLISSFDPFGSATPTATVTLPPEFNDAIKDILPTPYGFIAGNTKTLHGFDPVTLQPTWSVSGPPNCCDLYSNFDSVAAIDHTFKAAGLANGTNRYVVYSTKDGSQMWDYIGDIDHDEITNHGYVVDDNQRYPRVAQFFDTQTRQLKGPVATGNTTIWQNLRLAWNNGLGQPFIEVWDKDQGELIFKRYDNDVAGLKPENVYLAGRYLYIKNESDSPVIDLTTGQKVSSGWKVRPTEQIDRDWVLVASGDASSDVVECFRERKFICRDDDEASLSLVRAPNGQYSGPWY